MWRIYLINNKEKCGKEINKICLWATDNRKKKIRKKKMGQNYMEQKRRIQNEFFLPKQAKLKNKSIDHEGVKDVYKNRESEKKLLRNNHYHTKIKL